MKEIKVETDGCRVYLTGDTRNAEHLIKPLGAVWDDIKRCWCVALERLPEAEVLAADVNRIRKTWPGNSAEWWLGREDTEEARMMYAKLTSLENPPVPSAEDLGRARELIKVNSWQFAKTMRWCPHWYTLRRRWSSQDDFEWFVRFVRLYGVVESWRNYRHVYFYDQGWKYWSMGAPVETTILVNRARTV